MSQDHCYVIGAGIGKCGSTYIYEMLTAHPEVDGAIEKETNFFCDHWARGLQWYAELFPAGRPVRHEFSVRYCLRSGVAERIQMAGLRPSILICLRGVEDLVVSDCLHAYRKGQVRNSEDAAVFVTDKLRELRGIASHLREFDERFGDRVIRLDMDRFWQDPRSHFRALLEDLPVVDKTFLPEGLGNPVNRRQDYRLMSVERLIAAVSRGLQRLGWMRVIAVLKRTGLHAAIRRWNALDHDPTAGAVGMAAAGELRARADEVRSLERELRGFGNGV